jgi:hypothetical protein
VSRIPFQRLQSKKMSPELLIGALSECNLSIHREQGAQDQKA